jgi:alpha-glucosidase
MNEPTNSCAWPCDNLETFDGQTADVTHSQRQSNSTTGSKKGLPGRDLIDPPYKIRNAQGSISNLTVRTDLVHQGGWAEYDTHNL